VHNESGFLFVQALNIGKSIFDFLERDERCLAIREGSDSLLAMSRER